jgi:hypothetical protein
MYVPTFLPTLNKVTLRSFGESTQSETYNMCGQILDRPHNKLPFRLSSRP